MHSKIIIPEGTTEIGIEQFKNNKEIEEVVLPNSLRQIDYDAFRNCQNLKRINLPDSLRYIADGAFKDCRSLEEITIPKNVTVLSKYVFENCFSLKTLNIHDNITMIDDHALYDCRNLENFNLPKNIDYIGNKALMKCSKLSKLNIPASLTHIGNAAFALIDNLEYINVDLKNERYCSDSKNEMLLDKEGTLLQIAIKSIKNTYIADYVDIYVPSGNENIYEIKVPIYSIADYAFAGCKQLKDISVLSELSNIGNHSFLGCENLNELHLLASNYGTSVTLRIMNKIYKSHIPFKKITFGEGITYIFDDINGLFKNAEEVTLPSTIQYIGSQVFSDAKKLKEITIPENTEIILPNTFNKNTIINIPNIGKFKGKDFGMLLTKKTMNQNTIFTKFFIINNTCYIKTNNIDLFKIKLNENTYQKDKDDMIKVLFDIEHKIGRSFPQDKRITDFISNNCNEDFKRNFLLFASNFNYIISSFYKKISKSLNIKNWENLPDIFFEKLTRGNYELSDIYKIFNKMNDSLYRFITIDLDTNILENNNTDNLINYTVLLEKYYQKDRFLLNNLFFKLVPIKIQEELIKHFNKNIKNLIIESNVLDDESGNSINELLKICYILGVFDDDKVLSQKMSTFLNEKIIKPRHFNNLHTHFESLNPRLTIDYEFIKFFINSFEELIDVENNRNGFIADIYNYFPNISRTSTSNKGSQRHLLVTLDTCYKFLINRNKLKYNPEDEEIAKILYKYYNDSNNLLESAKLIIDESLNATRNIFNNVSDINDASYDLKEEEENSYIFEWLPKQDCRNLVLGKIVNCCAHIKGAGAGIMKASMVSNNCQNLVIKYNDCIVAKMTIYVNKENGYAVYNTAEVSYTIKDLETKTKIYDAFIRGTNAFINEYNKNNNIPITNVTIGSHCNLLEEFFKETSPISYDSIHYSNYRYHLIDAVVGWYDGDDKNKQLIVYKKKEIK